MKVNINQKFFAPDGVEVLKSEKGHDLTVKDICVASLLTPNQQDDEKKKWDKYEVFKKLRDAIPQDGMIVVELMAEEITLLKQAIGKTQTPLIMGQCWEALENGEPSFNLKNTVNLKKK
jgi:hypothetical protein